MPRPGRRPRLALLAALALAGGAAVADEPSPAPAPAPAPAPTAAPEAGTSKADAERRAAVLGIVDDLRAEASRVRGLPWKKVVPAEVISREQLRKNLEDMIREDLKPDEYDRDVRTLRRLALLRDDQDVLALELEFFRSGVAGYFNQKTKRIYVVDGLTSDAQRPTILHELVHALEDQYVDLEKSQKAIEKDSDRSFAFKCLVEGSAEHARLEYEASHPGIARLSEQEQARPENAAELRKVLAATPALLILPTLLQYRLGPFLVDRGVGWDYPRGMDRLYADPPVSEEQVLHPSKYFGASRDLPRRILWPDDLGADLGEGWKSHEASTVGELDFALWMDRWFGDGNGRFESRLMGRPPRWSKATQAAAEGWDGMWMQIFDQGGRTTGYAIASAWDSPTDAREAAEAVEEALARQYRDAFGTEGWKDGEGGARRLDFRGAYGPGRVEIRGDEVRVADGFPGGALDRLWPRLAAVKVERDPKDAWTATAAALEGTDWRSDLAGAGWKAPEGWTVETQPDGTGVAVHGETRARLSARPGGIEENGNPLIEELRRRYPDGEIDPSGVVRVAVGPKVAGRLRADDRDGTADAKNREVYLLVTDDALLVVEVESPRATWSHARAPIHDLLAGLRFRE